MQATILSRIANGRRAILALVLAVPGLGGCGATHVGDAWQCPLAQGTACTSVAEADPAVASSGKAQGLANPNLPHGAKIGDAGESARGCIPSCDPLAWLAELLGSGREDDDLAVSVGPEPAPLDEGPPDGSGDGLRTRERIARIWIAPFVDAEGVYREGHWVRAVLEPARWRLP